VAETATLNFIARRRRVVVLDGVMPLVLVASQASLPKVRCLLVGLWSPERENPVAMEQRAARRKPLPPHRLLLRPDDDRF
jgi:hypothetical protein